MKILSIEFENHPILGNLKLDFTDKNGNPVDTIILAGENGCGKTTILEELYNLWNTSKHNANNKGQYITTRVYLNEREINKIIQRIKEANNHSLILINPTGLFEVRCDLSTSALGCFDVKYQQEGSNVITPISCVIMSYLQSFAKSIFSTVDINYVSEAITTIQSSSLDTDSNGRKKSDIYSARKINQMFVDIDALDSSDLKAWTLEHIGIPAPRDIISPRIKRFSNAFDSMFDNLHFYKVDNISNTKAILFKKQDKIIPISRLSSGEKQIVYRGAYLLKDIKLDIGNTVLIDEPEISLHPEWQKKILVYYQKLFSDENGKQLSQMFVATHSPFIIHNPNRHNDKVVVLQKDDNGNIVQSDKPEYYDCNSCKVVEDSFSVNDFSDKKRCPLIFLEGRTDELYFNKAKELFGNKKLEYTFQWVGHLKSDGNEEFTGKDALNKLKTFILGNKNVFPDMNILLYDCDTNKKTEKIAENLIIKTLKKQDNPHYQIGIENLLNLPNNFNYGEYYKEETKVSPYGEVSKISKFQKMDLAKDICEKYSEEQQREILKNIGQVVGEIEKELFKE